MADFIGAANLIEGVVAARTGDGVCRVETAAGSLISNHRNGLAAGMRVLVVVRPEHVSIEASAPGANGDLCSGTVESLAYLGDSVDHLMTVGPLQIRARTDAARSFAPGTRVTVGFRGEACAVLPRDVAAP